MSLSQACSAALALVLFSSCGKEQVSLEQRTGAEASSPALAAAAPGSPIAGSPASDPGSSEDEDDTFGGLPPGVGVQTIEVVCTSTKRPHYRTAGNPRFGFCIDLPTQWVDGESSGNGDGWSIVFDDPAADVRVYGWSRPIGIDLRSEDREYYRTLIGPRGAISDFIFTDGVVGACVRNGQEIQYVRPGDTHWATLYVKADEAWLRRNERHLLTIARSLRAGERREGPVEFPRRQRRLEDEVLLTGGLCRAAGASAAFLKRRPPSRRLGTAPQRFPKPMHHLLDSARWHLAGACSRPAESSDAPQYRLGSVIERPAQVWDRRPSKDPCRSRPHLPPCLSATVPP